VCIVVVMVDDGPEQVPDDRNTPENIARENQLKADLETGMELHTPSPASVLSCGLFR
jgi:hypothetical protein